MPINQQNKNKLKRYIYYFLRSHAGALNLLLAIKHSLLFEVYLSNTSDIDQSQIILQPVKIHLGQEFHTMQNTDENQSIKLIETKKITLRKLEEDK